MNDGSLLSVGDVSIELGLSPQQIRNLCRNKDLSATKVGSTWVIEKDSVTTYKHSTKSMIAEDHARYEVNTSDKPIALSFFSGAMGLDIGLELSGFEIVLACEIDKDARNTIAANRPNKALIGDIRDYSVHQIREYANLEVDFDIDLIVGGPPCQAFSTAGKRNAFNDERGNVFLHFIDLAIELRPKYLVIENVRGLLSAPLKHRPHNKRGEDYQPLTEEEEKGGALWHILNRIRGYGYSVSFNLYNSANFGSPQIRERVIIICSRDGKKVPYLRPTHSPNGEFGLPSWRTFYDAVKDLSDTHDHIDFPEKRLRFYGMLKAGENWRNLPLELQKEALGKSYYAGGGKTGFLRRLAWDKPSPTVVTNPAMPATDLAHPEEDRPLSVQEYKRIQEFPDEWIICGTLLSQYKQLGNAVPVSLGKAVGDALLSHMKGLEVKEYKGFKYSRYRNTDDVSWEKNIKEMMEKKRKEAQQGYQLKLIESI